MEAITDNFWSKVKYTKSCWLWTGVIDAKGYGRFRLSNKKYVAAHRVIYELAKEPLYSNLQIDHLCRVKNCVNPDHLEQVTARVNVQRGIPFRKKHVRSALRTHCLQGHKYTKQNTIWLHVGGKFCAKCNAE